MDQQIRLNHLFEKHLSGTCSREEWQELLTHIAAIEDPANSLSEPMLNLWQKARNKELPSTAPLLDRNKIYKAATQQSKLHSIKTTWFRYAAAIILMLGVGSYLWYSNTTSNPATPINSTNPNSDVKAGSTKAILTLANGSVIELENNDNGKTVEQLAQAGAGVLDKNAAASKMQPSAQPTLANEASASYNTITTPRGGQYQLILPDGTKVWLNAASSIKFPTVFAANERRIAITGEAYLEVNAKRLSKSSLIKGEGRAAAGRFAAPQPFIITANGTQIQVLGTSFNINAYPEETFVKTTLLEGSIKVDNSLLKPGQAYINGSTITANIEQDIAWKNGYFQFDKAPLPTIMRQLARWYDLDVRYAGQVPDRVFKGKLQRSLPLSGILNLLEKGDVHFKLEGKTLTVLE